MEVHVAEKSGACRLPVQLVLSPGSGLEKDHAPGNGKGMESKSPAPGEWVVRIAVVLSGDCHLPATAPDILTGVRLALGVAWIVLVPAEYLGVKSGLGYAINDARDTLDYDRLADSVFKIRASQRVLQGMPESDDTSAVRAIYMAQVQTAFAEVQDILGMPPSQLGDVLGESGEEAPN